MIINILYLAFLIYMLPQITIMTATAIAAFFTKSYPEDGVPSKKFAVIVPAHNEESSLSDTINSLMAIDYPRELFEIMVIADNCTDTSAEIARNMAVSVFERKDETKKSKGFALEWLFGKILEKDYDAFVVIDADTLVSDNILSVFNNELLRGKQIVQTFYGVSNCDASWRTELLTYALSLFNGVYLLGLNGLGLGCALRGNGMCFSKEALKRVPWKASSLAEDMEYSWQARLAGIKAHYTDEAKVYAEMVSGDNEGAESQRKRWEEGRHQLRAQFKDELLKSDMPALSKALYFGDLFLDPLSKYAAKLLALCVLASFSTSAFSGISNAAFLALFFYLYLPVYKNYVPVSYLYSLQYAPRYLLWKLGVMKEKGDGSWKKTPREK